MRLSVKRVYDEPAKQDGLRVLIDRLWPRGVSKTEAHVDIWAKDVAPTKELRNWFHADPENRYTEFKARYRKELTPKKTMVKEIIGKHKKLTLVTAVRDIEHSHVPTLTSFLKKLV